MAHGAWSSMPHGVRSRMGAWPAGRCSRACRAPCPCMTPVLKQLSGTRAHTLESSHVHACMHSSKKLGNATAPLCGRSPSVPGAPPVVVLAIQAAESSAASPKLASRADCDLRACANLPSSLPGLIFLGPSCRCGAFPSAIAMAGDVRTVRPRLQHAPLLRKRHCAPVPPSQQHMRVKAWSHGVTVGRAARPATVSPAFFSSSCMQVPPAPPRPTRPHLTLPHPTSPHPPTPAAYLVVADEAYGRQIPFAFLERVRDEFDKAHAQAGRIALEGALNGSFSSRLKFHMKYCMEHPEEIDRVVAMRQKVSDVKGIMMDNIERVIDRGEKIEVRGMLHLHVCACVRACVRACARGGPEGEDRGARHVALACVCMRACVRACARGGPEGEGRGARRAARGAQCVAGSVDG
eukprot:358961-Chlamydomonas_euryale.AAC.10